MVIVRDNLRDAFVARKKVFSGGSFDEKVLLKLWIEIRGSTLYLYTCHCLMFQTSTMAAVRENRAPTQDHQSNTPRELDTRFIQTGYRNSPKSILQCLNSLHYLHNESGQYS